MEGCGSWGIFFVFMLLLHASAPRYTEDWKKTYGWSEILRGTISCQRKAALIGGYTACKRLDWTFIYVFCGLNDCLVEVGCFWIAGGFTCGIRRGYVWMRMGFIILR